MSAHAIENARAWLQSIKEMVAVLHRAGNHDEKAREGAEEAIHNAPLSVDVRNTGWRAAGKGCDRECADEYQILLSTGGPALRIFGSLERGYPNDAYLQWQDWGTEWTNLDMPEREKEAVREFARCFYFGEG